jgi:Concanavalin A-like lectin/glucanases superfamily
MPIPSGGTIVYDATQTSTLTLGGVTVTDGGTLDTAGLATQATAGLRPFYDAHAFGLGPTVAYGGLGAPLNPTTQYLSIASLAYQIPFTIVLGFRANAAYNLAELSADVASNPGVLINSGAGWSFRVRGPGGAIQNIDVETGPVWGSQNEFHWIAFTHDGTTPGLFVDARRVGLSVNQPAGPPGTGAITQPATIGAGHGGAGNLTGAIPFVGLWPRVFSASDLANMAAYFAAVPYRFTPSNFQLYDCQTSGDSIAGGATCAAISPNLYAYGPLLRQIFGFKFGQPMILELSGQTIPTIHSFWSTNLKPNLVSNGIKKVILNEGGVNDLIQFPGGINNPTDAATCAAAMVTAMHSWVTEEVAKCDPFSGGPHVILLHTCSFVGAAGVNFELARSTYNGNVAAAAPGWGTPNVIVQPVLIGSDPILGSAAGLPPPDGANTNYFTATGAIHPNQPGHQRWMALTAQAAIALGL